tara:strand:- start:7687 stop:9126 length:1440 start_codon:yes stop_codon:yes gene_type:complete
MRLTLFVIAGFLAIALTGFYFLLRSVYDDVERQYAQAAEEPMVDMAHLFAALIETEINEGVIDPARFRDAFDRAYSRELRAKIYNLVKTKLFTHVYITDANGIVLFDSERPDNVGEDFTEWRDVSLTLKGRYGARSSRTVSDNSLTSVLFVAAPIYAKGDIIGVVSVSRPEEYTMGMFVRETRDTILKSGIWAAIVVVVLGAAWTYWLLRPISQLTDYAKAVRFGERVELPKLGNAELRGLGQALEEMRDALEGKQYVETYVQTLTHELKSPLAAIRGAAELLDEEMPREKRSRFLENIRDETKRSEDLVRRLLQLAALESRKSLNKSESIDMVELIQSEIERVQPLLAARSLHISLDAGQAPKATVHGDRFTLQTALHNLLANAIDFSPEDGEVVIQYRVTEDEVTIRICDSGPGIPDYAETKVFDRFYSLKHTISGKKSSGLGLCFVKEAADLHNGSIRLEPNDPTGVCAILSLPVA